MNTAEIVRDTVMDDSTVYLEKLSLFSRILKQKGLGVSIRETEDAARMLTAVGMADRTMVKAVLCSVFAKSREEQLLFDTVFDGFFLSEEAMRKQAEEQRRKEQEREAFKQEAEQIGEQVNLSEQQREVYASMSEEARENLRRFMDRYKGSSDRNPKLYSEFIHSVFTKTILEQQMLMENAGENVLETDPDLGILYRDLGSMQDHEIPKAIFIIQNLAKRINGEITSKRKANSFSSHLDFRKTIRKGLETGGTFRRLYYQKKRQHQKQLIILCDVSGSMVQFTEFALRFIQALNAVSENSRIFLFSEKVVEADVFHLQNMDTFRGYVRDCGIYGRGTDLGSALQFILAKRPPILGSSTTMLILSDTKTIDQNRAMQTISDVKHQCGRVIWMNPIPESKWQYIRSVQMTASLVPMVGCSTLQELSAACRKLIELG